ncbi:hypothetical protein [Eubacterium pyruvativorans]|uniref:hypothetical protein n=1 Tax=Eubacterium pyruvativorans TaxID=155865 RepID=UPI0023EF5C6C|nr:hypothetical protein [Eubacterium pyruvativorans]
MLSELSTSRSTLLPVLFITEEAVPLPCRSTSVFSAPRSSWMLVCFPVLRISALVLLKRRTALPLMLTFFTFAFRRRINPVFSD